eukprot:926759_1
MSRRKGTSKADCIHKIPLYARLNPIQVPTDEHNAMFPEGTIPRKKPTSLNRPLNLLNVVCVSEDCDLGNKTWKTRQHFLSFYKKHKHYNDDDDDDFDWEDHMQVVSEMRTQHNEEQEHEEVFEEVRCVDCETLTYLSAPASPDNESGIFECSICLESLSNRLSKAIALDCAHTFHTQCIRQWCKVQNEQFKRCPLCRSQISKLDDESNDILIAIQNPNARNNNTDNTCWARICNYCTRKYDEWFDISADYPFLGFIT